MTLWTFVSVKGESALADLSTELTRAERITVDAYLDRLSQYGIDALSGSNMLIGPVATVWMGKRYSIFKLRFKIHRGRRPFRILMCRGPADPAGEATILCWCTEKGDRYVPPDAMETAAGNYAALLGDVERRRRPHEGIVEG